MQVTTVRGEKRKGKKKKEIVIHVKGRVRRQGVSERDERFLFSQSSGVRTCRPPYP